MVKGEYMHHNIPAGVMYPKPVQKPRPPILIGGYVDRVLQARGDGRRRLAHLFLPPGELREVVGQDPQLRQRRPARIPTRCSMPRSCRSWIGKSRAAVESEMMDWLGKEWDFASWSDSTKDSAIMGTVDECVAQLKEHLAVGVQKIIFVPYKYEMDQIETIAREIIPRLRS